MLQSTIRANVTTSQNQINWSGAQKSAMIKSFLVPHLKLMTEIDGADVLQEALH